MNPPSARCDGRAACRRCGDSGGGFSMSERREQRAAEALQRVSDRWQRSTDGGVESRHARQPDMSTGSGGSIPLAQANRSGDQGQIAGVASSPSPIQRAKADAGVGAQVPATTGKAPDAASSAPFTTYGRKSPFWRWT